MANTLIHESRRLRFPLETLVDALIELEDKQGHWPSQATVVGANIENLGAGGATVVLSLHQPGDGQVSERRYNSPKIAAAIVNYCVTMRVPMPRKSSKSIQVLADGVALVLENTVILHSRHEELSTLPAGSVQIAPPGTSPAAESTESAAKPEQQAQGNGAEQTPAATSAPDTGEPAAGTSAGTEPPQPQPEPTEPPPDAA